jgi:Sec-independent protein translocase protein TatA
MLIALLVVKPEQLPDVARKLGKMMRSVRGIINKITEEVNGLIDPLEKPSASQHEKKNEL